MTSTLDPFTLDGCDDPAGLLAYARAQKRVEDDAAREVLKAAAKWASMHSVGSLVGPVDEWHESCLPLGGEGCPEVAEFAIVEFAAAMGRSLCFRLGSASSRARLSVWSDRRNGQPSSEKVGLSRIQNQ